MKLNLFFLPLLRYLKEALCILNLREVGRVTGYSMFDPFDLRMLAWSWLNILRAQYPKEHGVSP